MEPQEDTKKPQFSQQYQSQTLKPQESQNNYENQQEIKKSEHVSKMNEQKGGLINDQEDHIITAAPPNVLVENFYEVTRQPGVKPGYIAQSQKKEENYQSQIKQNGHPIIEESKTHENEQYIYSRHEEQGERVQESKVSEIRQGKLSQQNDQPIIQQQQEQEQQQQQQQPAQKLEYVKEEQKIQDQSLVVQQYQQQQQVQNQNTNYPSDSKIQVVDQNQLQQQAAFQNTNYPQQIQQQQQSQLQKNNSSNTQNQINQIENQRVVNQQQQINPTYVVQQQQAPVYQNQALQKNQAVFVNLNQHNKNQNNQQLKQELMQNQDLEVGSKQFLLQTKTNFPYEPNSRVPQIVNCTRCKNLVRTNTEHISGTGTKVMCGILFIFTVMLLWWLPFCNKNCKNVKHTCPNCGNVCGTIKYLQD